MSRNRRRAATGVLVAAVLAVGLAAWLGSTGGDTSAHEAPAIDVSGPPPASSSDPCSVVVANVAAVQSAVSTAAPGAVICLADGTYGKLSLQASAQAPGVTVRAEHPGKASVAGADLAGSNLTVARLDLIDEVSIEPGSTGVVLSHNKITGGYFGVDAGPTTTTTVNDVSIVGNSFQGPFGEDAIRANRYHDANGDGVGLLIEGNEFTGVRENGNHSDCLQTVWVGDHLVYRKNYLHDNRCQGFFVKDQQTAVGGITVDDNLFLRNTQPCGAPLQPGNCGQPVYFQVFGPYTGFKMTHNTIWGDGVDSLATFQDGTSPDTVIDSNVIYRFWTSTNLSGIAFTNNTDCRRETSGGSWPASTPGETVDCNPAFANPAVDDYRLGNGRGVDWAPADQHYGP